MIATATRRRKPKTMLESEYVAGLESQIVDLKKELRSTQIKLERMTRAAAIAQIGLQGVSEMLDKAKMPYDAKAARDVCFMSQKAETTGGYR